MVKVILKYENQLSELTSEILKVELFGIASKKSSKSSLTGYMDKYILQKKNTWSKSTFCSYRNTLRKVEIFLKKRTFKDSFDSVGLDFYNQFVDFLFSPPYSFSINNVGKHIQNLKAILNAAVSDGKCKNLKFKHKSFKKLKQKISHIYLTTEEIQAIKDVELPFEKLSRCRDLLIILCYTGLRFSDLYKIDQNVIRTFNINNDQVHLLEILTSKTGRVVNIPCHPCVLEILRKYNYDLPRYSNPTLNFYIKIVAKMAGINSMVSVTTSIGGKPVIFNKPKYNFVCTHTGRRSLITNLYLARVDRRSIQNISGHVTETELSKYVGINGVDSSLSLAIHPFFVE